MVQVATATQTLSFGQNLRDRVFQGGVWLGTGSVIEQIVRFGRNMLLARILAPEAFGTMAIVLSTAAVVHTLTDMGVKEAIIQNPRGHEERYKGAAWWLALGRGVSLYALLFFLAPLVAAFYGNAELRMLLRVTGIAVLFDSTLSSYAYIAVKELRFSKWAFINHGGGIAGVLLTVVLSFVIKNVWALAIGYVAESLCRCALSYALCPYRPPRAWDKEAIRDLLRFSRGLVGLSFLNLIFSRTDVFVLAKMCTAAQLGVYALAVNLVQTPMIFMMNVLGQTLLPTFSLVRGDLSRANRILYKVSAAIVLLGLPALAFFVLCGRSLLTIVYGHRYSAAAGALAVASCAGLINLLNGQITTIFYSIGLPHLHRRAVAAMALVMISAVYPFTKWYGITGTQLACLAATIVGFSLQVSRLRRLSDLNCGQYLKSLFVAGGISTTVVAVCLASRSIQTLTRPGPNVALGIAACLIAYGLAAAILNKEKRAVV